MKVGRLLLWTGTMTVVALCAASVFAHEHGEKTEKVPAPYASKKNPLAGKKESVQAGKELYQKTCLGCHGAQGKGDGRLAKTKKIKPANLADAKMMKEMTDAALFWKISEGAGKGKMPSFKSKLTEQNRWHLVNYLRTLATPAASKPAKAKVKYTCPMHPEVVSNKPGTCPKCGMNLEKK